jgi:F-type H+-transporting ATPase subunit delta|tara:strand:+ start:877 stop:1272 length:396 start_codon:yes stop_codon:yes gene_type:complete
MAGNRKQIEFAKKLLEISIEDGEVNPERVSAILEELKKNPPAKYPKVLRAYLKLVKKEIKKYTAVLEHSGAISDKAILELGKELFEIYGRRIHVTTKSSEELIAGVRVSVGDDVYENSIISRMQPLRSISL